MILCGFDTETGGLHVGSNILELACVLWDSETHDVIEAWSTLCWGPLYGIQSEEALKCNGLSVERLKKRGTLPHIAFARTLNFFDKSEAICSHNGSNFDRPILNHELKQYGLIPREKVWIDSRTDFTYAPSTASKRLSHLAVDYGIDGRQKHRALDDVFMMLELAKFQDIDRAYAKAQSPLIRIEAQTTFEQKDLVKKHRFTWDGEKRVWFKEIHLIDYDQEHDNLPFDIKRIGDTNGSTQNTP